MFVLQTMSASSIRVLIFGVHVFADEVLALLLLRSLSDIRETLVVTLGNSEPEGKLPIASKCKVKPTK